MEWHFTDFLEKLFHRFFPTSFHGLLLNYSSSILCRTFFDDFLSNILSQIFLKNFFTDFFFLVVFADRFLGFLLKHSWTFFRIFFSEFLFSNIHYGFTELLYNHFMGLISKKKIRIHFGIAFRGLSRRIVSKINSVY